MPGEREVVLAGRLFKQRPKRSDVPSAEVQPVSRAFAREEHRGEVKERMVAGKLAETGRAGALD